MSMVRHNPRTLTQLRRRRLSLTPKIRRSCIQKNSATEISSRCINAKQEFHLPGFQTHKMLCRICRRFSFRFSLFLIELFSKGRKHSLSRLMSKMLKNLFLVPAGFSRHVSQKGIHAAIHQESNKKKAI